MVTEQSEVSMRQVKAIQTILFLSTSSGPGGAERVISNLAASLDPSRYRAVLCLFRQGWIQERSESRGVRTHIVPTRGMADWRWAIRFRRLLEEEHVDLIHAHEFDANVQGAFVAAMSGTPFVATVHGSRTSVHRVGVLLRHPVRSSMG